MACLFFRIRVKDMPYENIPAIVPAIILLVACGGQNTDSNVETPGAEKSGKTKALELGADILQNKSPLKKINAYLNGFHFYNGNINAQMEAHHYVSQLNEDVHQAIIYDGNGDDAKIMGVEYIISGKTLQNVERRREKAVAFTSLHEGKIGRIDRTRHTGPGRALN